MDLSGFGSRVIRADCQILVLAPERNEALKKSGKSSVEVAARVAKLPRKKVIAMQP